MKMPDSVRAVQSGVKFSYPSCTMSSSLQIKQVTWARKLIPVDQAASKSIKVFKKLRNYRKVDTRASSRGSGRIVGRHGVSLDETGTHHEDDNVILSKTS